MGYYLRGKVSSECGFERLKGVKGLVKYARGPGNMEVREVAKPVPGPGEVLVEVEAAGICGSDLHVYGDEIAIPIRVPVVVGHEFSGVVAAVGEGVGAVAPGMRVTALPSVRICGGMPLLPQRRDQPLPAPRVDGGTGTTARSLPCAWSRSAASGSCRRTSVSGRRP